MSRCKKSWGSYIMLHVLSSNPSPSCCAFGQVTLSSLCDPLKRIEIGLSCDLLFKSSWLSQSLGEIIPNAMLFLTTMCVLCVLVLPDACTTAPCQNGATCISSGSQYTCQCNPGYTGTYCETSKFQLQPLLYSLFQVTNLLFIKKFK